MIFQFKQTTGGTPVPPRFHPAVKSTVAIVTPSFNQGPYIGATIGSVLSQDYPRIEYIVMDGGSTDQTRSILCQYNDRIQWYSGPDEGQTDAINKGFSRLGGEILGWLNSDDTLAPGAVRAVVEYFEAHPEVAVVYGDADFIDPSGRWIGRCAHVERFDARRLLRVSDFIVQPAAFFRRSAFEAVGGLDKSLHWSMDYDLWLKLSHGGYRFAYIQKVLANYRWFGENKSAVGGMRRLDEVERVARRHGANHLPAYFCLEAVLVHLTDAMGLVRAGRVKESWGALCRAVKSVTGSRDAMRSLLDLNTWKIIWTGQVLRRRTRRRLI